MDLAKYLTYLEDKISRFFNGSDSESDFDKKTKTPQKSIFNHELIQMESIVMLILLMKWKQVLRA